MRQDTRAAYDPKWHPDIAQFARKLAEPRNTTEIRAFAERLYDHWAGQRLSRLDYDLRLEAFRKYERDPWFYDMEPLFIDSQLVEIAALLPYARPQTLAWLKPIHDELTCIARRTKQLRQVRRYLESYLLLHPVETLDFH